MFLINYMVLFSMGFKILNPYPVDGFANILHIKLIFLPLCNLYSTVNV